MNPYFLRDLGFPIQHQQVPHVLYFRQHKVKAWHHFFRELNKLLWGLALSAMYLYANKIETLAMISGLPTSSV